MKKIAVCIPSYNESNNISEITKIIDEGLYRYNKDGLYRYNKDGFDTVIVNCDNNSEDNTSNIFLNTDTKCSKYSIVNKKIGKGINIFSFFNFCEEKNIDYALTLDADLVSIKSNWIDNFLNSLFKGYDYVTPIYKRSRYEGSTTNHFAFPLVYAFTCKAIRQPIAGDFAFNSKFIKLINKYKYNESVEKYGIDIYMTLIAAFNDLKIKQIVLDKKIHNPSYNKIEEMFQQVLSSAIFTISILRKEKKYSIKKFENIAFDVNICRSREFKHKKRAIEYLNKYKVNNINLDDEWLYLLTSLLNGKEVDKDYVFRVFMYRTSKFWLDFQKISAYHCEKIICDFANRLLKEGGYYEKYNN